MSHTTTPLINETDMLHARILTLAVEAAHSACTIIKEGFESDHIHADSKEGRHNLVTEYDRRSEERIVSMIREVFPDHHIMAEESHNSAVLSATDEDYEWIIDPIDGTVNFAHKVPIFCVSIGVRHRGEIIIGVIYQPMTNELFTAVKGKGAFLNGKRLAVSTTATLDAGFLVTGFPYNVFQNPGQCIDHMVHFLSMGLPIRRLGSAALDLAYLAAGRFDGYWEVQLQAWDVSAGLLMVHEAGGMLTHYDGSPYRIGEQFMLASNGHIHAEMSQKLLAVMHSTPLS